jgi:hypothetical protein
MNKIAGSHNPTGGLLGIRKFGSGVHSSTG